MKFAFWKKGEDEDEDVCEYDESRAKRDGCRHDWTNWSNPIVENMPVLSPWGVPETSMREALVQARQCLKCNMHERRAF